MNPIPFRASIKNVYKNRAFLKNSVSIYGFIKLQTLLYGSLLLIFFTNAPLYAQTPNITAQVDRTVLTTDEVLGLTVVIANANDLRPQLPNLSGLRIVNSSSSFQITSVNGAVTYNNTFRYTLQPTQAGDLRIDPIQINVNGQTYSTLPIDIQVTQGILQNLPTPTPLPAQPAQPQAAPVPQQPSTTQQGDIFVEALVDNPTPYLGEQVLYIVRLYYAVSLPSRPVYTSPEFIGFWNQQNPPLQNPYRVQINNRTYQVSEVSTILFPTLVGERTIPPAQLDISGWFFQQGTNLRTEPVSLSVRPLPEPAPADFSGAVGQIGLTASVDMAALTVNEPLTLRLILQGFGNVDNWPDPPAPELGQWRIFESTSTPNTQVRDEKIVGSRVYEQLMVPTQPGEYTIPTMTYTYFDPVIQAYETTSTEPIIVTVGEGVVDSPIPNVPTVSQQEDITRRETDIRHIKAAPAMLSSQQPLWIENPFYWLAWLLPLLVLVIDFRLRRKHGQSVDTAQVRRTQAQKKARTLLNQARKEKRDPHETVGIVLAGYLTDRLNQPVTGMTQNMLRDELQTAQVDEDLITRVQDMLLLSEMGRFAPVSVESEDAKDLLKDVEQLIGDLERG